MKVSKKIFFVLTFFSLFNSFEVLSQSLFEEQSKIFIEHLINNNDKIINLIDESELKTSYRLVVQYEDVKHKFLISYDIDENVKKGIASKKLDYTITTRNLEKNYSKIVFTVTNIDYQKEFYFKNQKYISPITYFTKNWAQIKSKHFNFIVSDTTLFNSYCIKNLENYFNKIAELLELSEDQLNTIEREKIYYFLCKDEDEIKKITGFHTRGMYVLAHDYVVTTFNAHYHELLHLLINYKLQTLPLYTNPFLQEGFAVAFGGRGGKEPNIILNLGMFLNKSGMLDYSLLLSKKGFYEVNISLSYPMSGLYNLFLFEQLGLEKYLNLYKKYSGTSDEVEKMKIQTNKLPSSEKWNEFMDKSRLESIELWETENAKILVNECEAAQISENSENYYFALKDTLLIKTNEFYPDYKSKKFREIIKNRKYDREKYLITASENEIAVYNLFTNNLIANFVSSFSIPFTSIYKQNGYYKFNISKDVFDEKLNEMQLLTN